MIRMREGERYACSDPTCGCEVEVLVGAPDTHGGQEPRCCCGEPMDRVDDFGVPEAQVRVA